MQNVQNVQSVPMMQQAAWQQNVRVVHQNQNSYPGLQGATSPNPPGFMRQSGDRDHVPQKPAPVGWHPSVPPPQRLRDFKALCETSLLTLSVHTPCPPPPPPPLPPRGAAGPGADQSHLVARDSGEGSPQTRSPGADNDVRPVAETLPSLNSLQSTWNLFVRSFEAWTRGDNMFYSCRSDHGRETHKSEVLLDPSLADSEREESREARDASAPPWVVFTAPVLCLGEAGGNSCQVTGRRLCEVHQGADERTMSSAEFRDVLSSSRATVCSLKGNKSTAPNQDRAVIASLRGLEVLGVFDGHGEDGHAVAELSTDGLPKLLLAGISASASSDRDPDALASQCQDAAGRAFVKMHGVIEDLTATTLGDSADSGLPQFDARSSGTTATVVLLLQNQRALLAHVGDSRAVLGVRRMSGHWRAVELTRDHKPSLPYEKARIESTGAQVISTGPAAFATARIHTPQQPWPMINMTRSLGDLHAHTQGLVPEPEVRLAERLWDPATEEAVLIIGSDGIWDVIEPLQAVEFVVHQRADAASSLAHEAYARWGQRRLQGKYSDDITVVVKFL